MPRKIKKERMHERNDSCIIIKADGGMVEADDVYQEFGELHSDTDGVTINLQHKVAVLKPTVLGRPPVQDKMVYYVDQEPNDCGFDPEFMFGKLKSAYTMSARKRTIEAQQEKSHQRTMDIVFVVMGVSLLLFAFVIAPIIGFTLNTDNSDEGPRPPGNGPSRLSRRNHTNAPWTSFSW